MFGGPNHVKNYCDAPFLFHTEKEELTQREIQTYLKHFSHNIQPGAVRIGFSRYTDKIELTAFRRDSTIIVILLNRTEEELPAYLRLHDQCAKITVAPPQHCLGCYFGLTIGSSHCAVLPIIKNAPSIPKNGRCRECFCVEK